jgi:hypothetical protein
MSIFDYIWPWRSINLKLDRIIQSLIQEDIKMSAEFDALVAQVTASTQVEASAITLIQGLSTQIADLAAQLAGTPAGGALQALSDQLKASAADLATAITANTPAAPPA